LAQQKIHSTYRACPAVLVVAVQQQLLLVLRRSVLVPTQAEVFVSPQRYAV
jgi:hypothetical protein